MRFALSPFWAQSLILGHLYVGLCLALGFANRPHYDNGAIFAHWRLEFHWASWLGLGLLCAGGLTWAGIAGAWWVFGGLCAFTVTASVFLALAPHNGYTLAIGHGVVFSKWATLDTEAHERIHVDQVEDLCFLASVISLCLLPFVDWRVCLGLWATSGSPWLLLGYVTGFFRHKRKGVTWFDAAYGGASHERAAYSLANGFDSKP